MADTLPTKQVLIDAHTDADTLEQAINGAPNVRVKARLGREYWTLATLDFKINAVEVLANQGIASINNNISIIELKKDDAINQINEKVNNVEYSRANAIASINEKSDEVAQEFQDKFNELDEAIAQISIDSIPATAVPTSDGKTQQQINDFGGAKWRSKAGGYELNARAILDDGRIVRSTENANLSNPNSDMQGWRYDDNLVTLSELKKLKPISNIKYYVNEKQGFFQWLSGNYSAMTTLDTAEGIYIASSSVPSNIGAWKRIYTGLPYASWFDAINDTSKLQVALNVCKYQKGIIIDSENDITMTSQVVLDGFNDFELVGYVSIKHAITTPFLIKNSVNVRSSGFKNEYTSSSTSNAVLFDVEDCENVQLFNNETKSSALATPLRCKNLKIYNNIVDINAKQNQPIQLQGCNDVYIFLNEFKNGLIDGIKITGDVNSGIFIYNNHFEDLGGYSTQGDCVDCYSGGTNVVIYKNTATRCRQLANIKKGDTAEGDAPTSKVYVEANICLDVGNLCQVWNVNHVTIKGNRMEHTSSYIDGVGGSMIYMAYSIKNIKIIDNEFINIKIPYALIYASDASTLNNVQIVGNSATGTDPLITYADIYIKSRSVTMLNIERNNFDHDGTNLAVRITAFNTTDNLFVNIANNRFKNGVRIDNMSTTSEVSIINNKIDTTTRPLHFGATTSAPILHVSRNSMQGRALGTTAQRPVLPNASADAPFYIGQQFFDTTLGKPIFIKNTNPMQWVDSSGSVV